MNRGAAAGLVLALLAAANLSAMGLLDDTVIFPGAQSQGRQDAQFEPGLGSQVVHRNADGERGIAVVYGSAETAGGRLMHGPAPTVLFFYGNGACAAHMAAVFERMRRLGVNVAIPDYPGYGMSLGHASESGCYAAADAAYEFAASRKPGPTRIVAIGWSLGGGVAVDLASRRPVAALMTISAFTSVPAVARDAVPWLPVTPLISSRFDNLKKLGKVRCPVFIAHGELDNIIPPSMAAGLAAAAPAPVTPLMLPGAGHNDVFDAGGDRLWAMIRAAAFGPAP